MVGQKSQTREGATPAERRLPLLGDRPQLVSPHPMSDSSKPRERNRRNGQRAGGNNRERILEVSLELFNERGSVAVSTKTIAAHLGISPGNFYYHFTDKEHVIRELYARCQSSLMPTVGVPPDGSVLPPEALANFFIAIIDNGWKFRFINRDINELVARDPEFAASFRSDMEIGRHHTMALLESLIDYGLLSISNDHRDLEYLCANIRVHLLNWTRFLSTVRGKTNLTKRDIAEGALHAFVMLQPYLDPAYADQVRTVLERHVRGRKSLGA